MLMRVWVSNFGVNASICRFTRWQREKERKKEGRKERKKKEKKKERKRRTQIEHERVRGKEVQRHKE